MQLEKSSRPGGHLWVCALLVAFGIVSLLPVISDLLHCLLSSKSFDLGVPTLLFVTLTAAGFNWPLLVLFFVTLDMRYEGGSVRTAMLCSIAAMVAINLLSAALIPGLHFTDDQLLLTWYLVLQVFLLPISGIAGWLKGQTVRSTRFQFRFRT
jgi:hypothetical protein